ncbi:MAG: TIGR03546 family protein [Gammaproteobacteria bacterium]|nr:TIGR03546 family protein [Gammaproteobacteria bacterium]
MFWIKLLRSFFKALRASEHPNQIAGGFALGFAVGLMPGWPLQVWLVVMLILLLNVNIGLAFAGAGIAAAFGWLLDPAIEPLGRWLLTGVDGLRPIWTAMYNSPVWLLTRFNNTTMMGTLAAALVLVPLVFFALRALTKRYQAWLRDASENWRIMKIIRASRVFGFFDRLMG